MTNFARGKYAKSISDRSGMEFPYSEMVREWNGSRVHISEFEPKQPQLELKVHAADPAALLILVPEIPSKLIAFLNRTVSLDALP